jgi:ubiquinone/menaquinone biosynthesis C-methylase UbiE
VWLPAFVCPECQSAIDRAADDRVSCTTCARSFELRGGIWRFLVPSREARLAAFAQQYRLVREREGRRVASPTYYMTLPIVPAHDPNARDWRIRHETYRHLLRRLLAAGKHPSAILDVGAGSAWLSYRLATLGHRVVAVDAIADEVDGLGAVRHYDSSIVALQADFDALPLAPEQFDLVVFNGSLHYAPDPNATLARARRLLAPAGTLVVMDSPMFRADRDGVAMVAGSARRLTDRFGLHEIVQLGSGYLTFASLAAVARTLQMTTEFVPSRGPLAWRMRRQLARLKLGRQPASFGMWVAR